MKTTTNYGLKKPETTDFYNVSDSNENLDIIDTELKKTDSAMTSHLADTVSHVTAAERTKWNAKVDASGTVANADTVDGKHANDIMLLNNTDDTVVATGTNINNIINAGFYTLNPIANTYTNVPIKKVCSLWVLKQNYSTRVKQILLSIENDGVFMMRGTIDSGSTWSPWVTFNDGGNSDTLDGKHASDFILASSSAKVVISTSAPSDTTSLWVDTSNMKMKIYKNNAWTTLS